MPALRPIGHEERLSLVEHLDELRTRIIWCIVAFGVAFAFTYWQNDAVLDIVNKPVVNALKPGKNPKDQLGQTTLFQQRVGAMAKELSKALPAIERAAIGPKDKAAVAQAARAAQAAAVATPTNQARRPVTFGITEPFLTTFKVAGYAAILLALPIILYQLYAFILPAFTDRERRAVTPVLFGIPLLFIAGVAFGYFIALPRAANFLLNFNEQNFDIQLRAQDYYSFSITFLAVMGLLFQVPMAVMALVRLGIVSVAQLRKNRGYVVLAVAVIAAVATPTPDPVTMLVCMAPLLILFELSILGASVLERRSEHDGDFDDDELDLID